MPERIISGSEIINALPDDVQRWVVAKITGVSTDLLTNWERRGLITPKITPDGAKTAIYPRTQIAKAFLIKSLCQDKWTYEEISDHLSQPQWLKRNMKVIEAAIGEVIK